MWGLTSDYHQVSVGDGIVCDQVRVSIFYSNGGSMLYVLLILAASRSMQDLSSLTQDQTHALYRGNAES